MADTNSSDTESARYAVLKIIEAYGEKGAVALLLAHDAFVAVRAEIESWAERLELIASKLGNIPAAAVLDVASEMRATPGAGIR